MSYTGNILMIDLTSEKIETVHLDGHEQKHFLGSRGLAAKMLYENAPGDVDPFASENPFCFMTGPLTGTPAFGPNGYFTTVSPLTNGYLDSGVKGQFPAKLKLAGYDGFVITGKAETPVYVYIDNEKVEIKKANDLWGKDCIQTDRLIKEKLQREDVHIASIGPAGENKVRFACITSDIGRQAGRGGAGAVMGSKNLKAIVVSGKGSIEIASPDEFLELVKKLHQYIRANSEPLRTYGTLWLVDAMNDYKMLPTRNFRFGQIDHPETLNGEYAEKRGNKRNMGCYSCSLLCSNHVTVVDSKGRNVSLEGPEYESLALLGPNCGLESFEDIAYLNALCDRLGIDTMSAGGVISFCMELYERGLLDKNDTDGLNLTWGNAEAMAQLLERIAYRKGIGNTLAEGSKKAAEEFGKDSLQYAMHVKGMEMPGYDPRGATGMALAYATADRGACHLRAWTIYEEVTGALDRFSYEGKAALVAARQNRKLVIDSLGICEQMGLLPIFAELYTAATGIPVKTIYNNHYETLLEDFSLGEGPGIGAKIYTLTRAFNVKRGFDRQDDNLPSRFFKETLKTKGEDIPAINEKQFQKMIDAYYEINGWDKDGIPLKATLEKYGLNHVINELY